MAAPIEPNPAPEPTPVDKICGVDAEIIKRFLVLIRDNYPKADRASFFLEEVAGKTHTLVMANLRDVLSHLATTLSEETDPKDWEAQIASAEEHFRRAIQEPYAVALGNLREKFNAVHAGYQKIQPDIINMKNKGFFANAPTEEIIQAQLRGIAALASEGRSAKRRNRIDPKWDEGVTSYIEAYNKLDLLTGQLSGHLHEHSALTATSAATQTATHHTRLHRWGIAWAIAGIIIGIVGTYLFTKYADVIADPVPKPPASDSPLPALPK